jgi:nucleotide-binding universal stress UspA family protein
LELREIVVHVDDSPRAPPRIEVGLAIAARHDARLVGVFVTPPPPSFPVHVPETILKDLLAAVARDQRASAATAEAAFRKRAGELGVATEWRVQEGDTSDVLAVNARYADLVIVSQTPPDQTGEEGRRTIAEDVLMTGGGPALIVPHYGTFRTVGERAVVAWDASPTAARAVRDAMPLLAKSSKVTVLAVNPETSRSRHGSVPGADIALHLARHGVVADTAFSYSDEVGVGDMILSRAADLGADLIVMGAYGHARLREALFGGVTRHLLAHMTAPVLMSR